MVQHMQAHLKGTVEMESWACMAASGMDSLICIDDGTPDGSSGQNSEIFTD